MKILICTLVVFLTILSSSASAEPSLGSPEWKKQFDTPFFRGDEGRDETTTDEEITVDIDSSIADFKKENADLNFNQWITFNKSSKSTEARKRYLFRVYTVFFATYASCSVHGGRFSKEVPLDYSNRKVIDNYGYDWSFFFSCLNTDGSNILSDIYFVKSKDGELEHNLVVKEIDTSKNNKVVSTKIYTAQDEYDLYEIMYSKVADTLDKDSGKAIFRYAIAPVVPAKNKTKSKKR